jgi:limonene-1,2-epoxide hydrolase
MTPEQIVLSLFTAVESGDLGAIGTHFAENATYSNIPYEPAVGRNAIIEMFRPIVTRSERIEWQIRTIATAEHRVHCERLDCFWIKGQEYAVPCHCVVEVDLATQQITAFRDYVDIGKWRETLGNALTSDE